MKPNKEVLIGIAGIFYGLAFYGYAKDWHIAAYDFLFPTGITSSAGPAGASSESPTDDSDDDDPIAAAYETEALVRQVEYELAKQAYVDAARRYRNYMDKQK